MPVDGSADSDECDVGTVYVKNLEDNILVARVLPPPSSDLKSLVDVPQLYQHGDHRLQPGLRVTVQFVFLGIDFQHKSQG